MNWLKIETAFINPTPKNEIKIDSSRLHKESISTPPPQFGSEKTVKVLSKCSLLLKTHILWAKHTAFLSATLHTFLRVCTTLLTFTQLCALLRNFAVVDTFEELSKY